VAYKKISIEKAPKRTRKAVSRFELTEEWRLLKADIDRGFKPSEMCQIIFGEEDKKKYNIHNRRSIARFIQGYVRTHKLLLQVKSFEQRQTGSWVVLVQYRPHP
jgi:hypothetical protein